jgi:hypothetical protein
MEKLLQKVSYFVIIKNRIEGRFMVNDLYENYYNYKVKTIYQYSMLLSRIIGINKNKLFSNNKNREDFWRFVTNDFLNKYSDQTKTKLLLIKEFINAKDIIDNKTINETMSVINYFITHSMALQVSDYYKEIILASTILKIANNLDISTSPYFKNKNNYNTIVVNNLEDANKIPFIESIDEGKKNTKILIELVKTNVRRERKIFDLLTNKGSFNKYIDISKENIYYLAQYNYNVPNLKRYDDLAISKVYNDNGYDDKFILISAELISSTLMKMLSLRKKNKIFFLPIKSSFFDNNDNLKELNKIINNPFLNKSFKILINYDDYNNKIMDIMKKNKNSYYIYCSNGSKANNGSKLMGCNNYLISKDFYNNNMEIIKRWQNDSMNIIIEKFDGIVTDKDLLNE